MPDDAKTNAGDKTVSDADGVPVVGGPPKVVCAAEPDLKDQVRAGVMAWFYRQTPKVQLAIVAGLVAAVLLWKHFHPDAPPVVLVTVPTPEVTVVPPSQFEARQEYDATLAGRRLMAKLIRNRVASQLQKDGFAQAGGSDKPLDKLAAWNLLANLDDDALIAAAQQTGALGDGKLLDRLGDVLQWIADHREEILAIIKLVLGILMLFAADIPPG